MIRPVQFGFNAETAVDNAFQQKNDAVSSQETQNKALAEFDSFVGKLREVGVTVHAVDDTNDPHTPDSIFPNNWISFHEDATICLYPMAAKSRRLERKATVLQYLEDKFLVKTVIDFTRHEKHGKYLEGTGSMILDRENHIAYGSISERTDRELFEKFCQLMGYQPVTFHSVDQNGKPIYHTNVIMFVADKYAVVCFDAISFEKEKEVVRQELEKSGKAIVSLTYKQLNSFGGNMLQVKGSSGNICVMSTQAYESLDFQQIEQIKTFDKIVHSDLATIEANGGGSARCMMAEVFLQAK